MKILVFGGTTEGRILAERLPAAGCEVTVSVATEAGLEPLKGTECRKLSGRRDAAEMEELVRGFDLGVDATHPYAAEASRNIRQACRCAEVPLRRVLREASADAAEDAGIARVGSCREAAELLENRPGNVLITTGSKELEAYAGLDPERLYPRVLPTHEALAACERLGIPRRNILALYGPFSEEMNRAMLRQYGIRFLVTKDGGVQGGFREKMAAARQTGTELILIRRPEDSGIPLEELLGELAPQPHRKTTEQ